MKSKNLQKIRKELKNEFWKGGKRSKLCCIDRWFSVGNGKISYAKYLIAYITILFPIVETTVIMAAVYGLTAFILGFAWDWYNLNSIGAKISNIINRDMFDRIEKRASSRRKPQGI